jgi:two-component system chemotaxis response regulator CheB
MPNQHDIVVIGGSSGAVDALLQILPDLPLDLPAAIFVVLHVAPDSPNTLPQLFARQGNLPTESAADGVAFRRGRVYLAPPDRHLLLERKRMVLTDSARQNGFRPAVDPLFRSAAQQFGPRVIGLVLSGDLDDGTAGLIDIKLHGGVALAQDPADASFPGMPRSAVANVELDHVVPLHKIAARLTELIHAPVNGKSSRGHGRKNLAARRTANGSESDPPVPGPETPRHFTCPDCGGAMWELTGDKQLRFRCHTGHVFSAESLSHFQDHELENAVWAAIRTLQESAELRRRMANRLERGALRHYAKEYLKIAQEAETQAGVLRHFLTEAHLDPDKPPIGPRRRSPGKKSNR